MASCHRPESPVRGAQRWSRSPARAENLQPQPAASAVVLARVLRVVERATAAAFRTRILPSVDARCNAPTSPDTCFHSTAPWHPWADQTWEDGSASKSGRGTSRPGWPFRSSSTGSHSARLAPNANNNDRDWKLRPTRLGECPSRSGVSARAWPRQTHPKCAQFAPRSVRILNTP